MILCFPISMVNYFSSSFLLLWLPVSHPLGDISFFISLTCPPPFSSSLRLAPGSLLLKMGEHIEEKGKVGRLMKQKHHPFSTLIHCVLDFLAALTPEVAPSSEGSANFQNGAGLFCIPKSDWSLSTTPPLSCIPSPLLSMSLFLVLSQTENPGIQGVSFPVFARIVHFIFRLLAESSYLTAPCVVLPSNLSCYSPPDCLLQLKVFPFLFKKPNSIFLSTSSWKYSPWARGVNRAIGVH